MQGTTCRLVALCYRTTQGARPGQKWLKIVQLQPKVQTQETQSTPEASHSLNLLQDRETNVIHILKLLREVGTFKSITAHFSASAHVHFLQQHFCRSTAELHYMLEVSLREEHGGVVCVGLRAATYCVTCVHARTCPRLRKEYDAAHRSRR